MTTRLRSMSDDELGRALAGLDLAWPPDPDLAPRVIAATRGRRHPKILRLPLSRTKRILLIAAATVLLLAGAAVAARFLVDLGAVVVERTPGPVAQPSSTASGVFQSCFAAPADSTAPGATALTRIRCAAHSAASVWVIDMTPAFAAAECTVPGLPVQT